MIVPTKEMEQLVQFHKGQITGNALLNKVARLAAESHLLLKDKSTPDALAIKKIGSKRVRQFGPVSGQRPDEEEDEKK